MRNEMDFETGATLTSNDIACGTLVAPPPLTEVRLVVSPPDIQTYQTIYFAIKTLNQEGLLSSMSNVPSIFLPSGQPVPVPPPATTSFFRFGKYSC